jgi:hypothetical protein
VDKPLAEEEQHLGDMHLVAASILVAYGLEAADMELLDVVVVRKGSFLFYRNRYLSPRN